MNARVDWSADNVGKILAEYVEGTDMINSIVKVTAVGERNFLALIGPHYVCELSCPKYYDNDEWVWRYHD